MPSASSKQHRFMSAVAHNPTFAKKAGVPQSVGKDFAAADKGRKFGRGGRAGINIQNTQHGSMDMPFKSLRRYAGLKGGGEMNQAKMSDKMKMMMQKRVRPAMRPTGTMVPMRGMNKGGKAKYNPHAHLADEEGNTIDELNKKNRSWKSLRSMSDPERMGRQAGAEEYPQKAQRMGSISNPIVRGVNKGAAYLGEKYGDLRDDVRTALFDDDSAEFRKGQRAVREKYYGYKKGGMHRMPGGKMMKDSAMKKGGMPMKDGKPAFMMKKKMMGGGMAKYAKGGGIESRGKTKGTVIRMASGGSVSSRADGIAQRGKTKFKTY